MSLKALLEDITPLRTRSGPSTGHNCHDMIAFISASLFRFEVIQLWDHLPSPTEVIEGWHKALVVEDNPGVRRDFLTGLDSAFELVKIITQDIFDLLKDLEVLPCFLTIFMATVVLLASCWSWLGNLDLFWLDFRNGLVFLGLAIRGGFGVDSSLKQS